jgi:chorismate mutase/prephenate dehydratase
LAKIRQQNGEPLYDLAEEQEGLVDLLTQNKGPLDETAVRSIYREIFGTARSLVKPIRVSYLGPRYSYSHLAAIDRFGDGPDLTPVATIKAVFESLHFNQTDFGGRAPRFAAAFEAVAPGRARRPS